MLGSCREVLVAGSLRRVGCPIALMLLIGVSACTTADPRSAATPTVPYTSATGTAASPGSSGTMLPRPGGKKRAVVPQPDHVVVVMLENEQRSSIIGSTHAPYLNRLAARGANLTHSYGLTHPSQPNYLALFSGVDPRRDQRCLPAAVSEDRKFGPSAPNSWIQLRRICRVPAQSGLHRMRVGSLRA